MTVQQAYDNFVIKVNKNSTTDSVAVDKGRFVSIFLEEQIRFLEYILEKKNEDELRYVNHLLKTKTLLQNSDNIKYQSFNLPKDFFDFENVYGVADSKDCKDIEIELTEKKAANMHIILNDPNERPSLDYRQAPFRISSNKVDAYKNQYFDYKRLILDYYKYPREIALINPENPESNFDDFQPEWDDKSLNRILNRCAASMSLINDSDKFQAETLKSKNK